MSAFSQDDRAFLRGLPITIVVGKDGKISRLEDELIKRARPFWLARDVSERATTDNIGRQILCVALTDAGYAKLSRTS